VIAIKAMTTAAISDTSFRLFIVRKRQTARDKGGAPFVFPGKFTISLDTKGITWPPSLEPYIAVHCPLAPVRGKWPESDNHILWVAT